ncbi:MAG: hypothetical protein H0W67_04500 [Gemmatimonadales bacterium]|nr:hypothetical protein [Gemmatimonadales bacterium]
MARRLLDQISDFMQEFKTSSGGYRTGGTQVGDGDALTSAWFQFQRGKRSAGQPEFVRFELAPVVRDGAAVVIGRRFEGDDPYELGQQAAAWVKELA